MNKNYKRFAEGRAKRSPIFKNCIKAFTVGGLICVVGQGFHDVYRYFGVSEETAKLLVPVTMIAIAALLTGFGIFDTIAKHAGAGTLVPITGFANSVVAPAIDNKAEGWILGLGAKIFIISGPVILYGTLAGVIYGAVYYLMGLIAV